MTICIAAICQDGSAAVAATDTMLTNDALSIEFEHPGKKLTTLANTCVALTAGDALAHTELFDGVAARLEKLKKPTVREIAETIKECYQTRRRQDIRDRFLRPRGFDDFVDYYAAHQALQRDVVSTIQYDIDRYNYGLTVLLAGTDDNTAHIYGVANPGITQCFDAVGYHAIGSGLPHAINALVARGCNQTMGIPQALFIVYEAKKRAEKAPGVGSVATDITIIQGGKLITLSEEAFSGLERAYNEMSASDPDLAALTAVLPADIRGSNHAKG